MALSVIKSIIRFWYHIIEAHDTSIIKMTYMDGLDSKTALVKRIEKRFAIVGFTHVWENQNTFSVKKTGKSTNQ